MGHERPSALPIVPAHIAHVCSLAAPCPFDRLLVAQASVEGSTLFVADAALTRYGRFVRMA